MPSISQINHEAADWRESQDKRPALAVGEIDGMRAMLDYRAGALFGS
jgi:hypothetical protein